MTKSIFEKITLDKNAEEALRYAHSEKYREKRKTSEKSYLSSTSIRKKRVDTKKLLG